MSMLKKAVIAMTGVPGHRNRTFLHQFHTVNRLQSNVCDQKMNRMLPKLFQRFGGRTSTSRTRTATALQAAVQANHFGVMQVHNLKETMTRRMVKTILATLKPTTLLAKFNAPQLEAWRRKWKPRLLKSCQRRHQVDELPFGLADGAFLAIIGSAVGLQS